MRVPSGDGRVGLPSLGRKDLSHRTAVGTDRGDVRAVAPLPELLEDDAQPVGRPLGVDLVGSAVGGDRVPVASVRVHDREAVLRAVLFRTDKARLDVDDAGAIRRPVRVEARLAPRREHVVVAAVDAHHVDAVRRRRDVGIEPCRAGDGEVGDQVPVGRDGRCYVRRAGAPHASHLCGRQVAAEDVLGERCGREAREENEIGIRRRERALHLALLGPALEHLPLAGPIRISDLEPGECVLRLALPDQQPVFAGWRGRCRGGDRGGESSATRTLR